MLAETELVWKSVKPDEIVRAPERLSRLFGLLNCTSRWAWVGPALFMVMFLNRLPVPLTVIVCGLSPFNVIVPPVAVNAEVEAMLRAVAPDKVRLLAVLKIEFAPLTTMPL